MRLLPFQRRRRRRVANAIEQVTLRILAALWVARLVLRRARIAAR